MHLADARFGTLEQLCPVALAFILLRPQVTPFCSTRFQNLCCYAFCCAASPQVHDLLPSERTQKSRTAAWLALTSHSRGQLSRTAEWDLQSCQILLDSRVCDPCCEQQHISGPAACRQRRGAKCPWRVCDSFTRNRNRDVCGMLEPCVH